MDKETFNYLIDEFDIDSQYYVDLYREHGVVKTRLAELMYDAYKVAGLTFEDAKGILDYLIK